MSDLHKGKDFNFVYVDEEELTQSYNSIQRQRRKLQEEKVWEAFCQDDLGSHLNDFKDDQCVLNVPNSALNAHKLLEGIENTNRTSKGSFEPVEESENEDANSEQPPQCSVSEVMSNLDDETIDDNTTPEDIREEDGAVTYLSYKDIEKPITDSESDESSDSDCNSEFSEDENQSDSESSEYSNSSNAEIHEEIIVEVHAEDEVIPKDESKGVYSIDVTNKNINGNEIEKCTSQALASANDNVSGDKQSESIKNVAKTDDSKKNIKSESSEVNVQNKYSAHTEKIAWTREKIVVILKSILVYEENSKVADCSDDSDTGRLRKRAGEFAKRFARNYVYQPQRQLDNLKKSMKSSASRSQPRIQIAAVSELHQSLLKALQEYKRQLGRLGESGTDLACHTLLSLLVKADEVCRRVSEMHNLPELQYALKHDMQPLIESILSLIRDSSSSSGTSAGTLPRSQSSSATEANVRSQTKTCNAYSKPQLTATAMVKSSPFTRKGFTKPLAKSSGVDLSMYTMNTPWPESPVKKSLKQNKTSPKTPKNNAEPMTMSTTKLNICKTHNKHKHKSDSQPQSSGYKQNNTQSTHKLSKPQSRDFLSQNIRCKSPINPQTRAKQNISNLRVKQNDPNLRKQTIAQKQKPCNKVAPISLPNQSPRKNDKCSGVAADDGTRRSSSRSGAEKVRKRSRSAKPKSDRSVKTMVSEMEIEDPELLLELNEEYPQHKDVGQVYKWFKSTETSIQTEVGENQYNVEEERTGPKNAQLIIVKERPRKIEINLNSEIGQLSIEEPNVKQLNQGPLINVVDKKSGTKLEVSDMEWKNAHRYRQEYIKTLVDSPMYNAQFKKPWELVGRLSDTMVDDMLQKVVLEMQDDIVRALCHSELK